MTRLLVRSYTISLDGYGAGPNQTKETPLGVGGEELHDWLVNTRTFFQMQKKEGGDTGIDETFASKGFDNAGAWILPPLKYRADGKEPAGADATCLRNRFS